LPTFSPNDQLIYGLKKKHATGLFKVSSNIVVRDVHDDLVCRVAKTLEEAKNLIEAGFEYVTDMEEIKLFRKRK